MEDKKEDVENKKDGKDLQVAYKHPMALAAAPTEEVEGYKRETWSNKLDFLLACIGFSVGLGNVWRFPYLCYKNGGGAFLLPYFLSVFISGVPLFYLEVALGQFMGRGGLKTWNLIPLFQGIGIATCIIMFLINCYYNVILCWGFYYMFNSFQAELPWAACGHEWNTIWCNDDFGSNKTVNDTIDAFNITRDNNTVYKFSDPVTEFWEYKTLAISDGVGDVGTIKWDLALCLLFAWIVVYACICKGIKSSGKVMYITATSPYIFMLILLIRNALLDGAYDGVLFYLTPDLSRLSDVEVWVDAGTQIFFSYSISLGTLNALGSYNKFNHNSYRDAILFALANSGTSFFAGFIVFTILGYMAKVQGVPIAEVAESGPGLAFIAYPKAVAQMPISPLWSILFFLMIILLGLDSQFVGVEGVVTAVVDQYPKLLRKGYNKEIFIGCICVINFFVGLSMVTNGGMYVFQIFDYYAGSRMVLLIAFFELVAVAWVYGVNRFYDNIEMMLGRKIWPYMKFSWLVGSPLFCLIVFILSTINYTELTYARPSGVYVYPDWAVGIGWAMACSSVVFIPIAAIHKFWKYGWTMEVFWLSLKPYGLKDHQKRIQDINERSLKDLRYPQSTVQYNAADKNGEVNIAYIPDKVSSTAFPDGKFTQIQ